MTNQVNQQQIIKHREKEGSRSQSKRVNIMFIIILENNDGVGDIKQNNIYQLLFNILLYAK